MNAPDAGDGFASDSMPSTRRRPGEVNPAAYPDPYVLLQAERVDGQVVDFIYLEANRSACEALGLELDSLLGRRLLEVDPEAKAAGLLDLYVQVVESGEPLTLDDWEYPAYLNHGRVRHFDLSAVRVGDGLGLAWWDVTSRYAADRDVARAERELSATLDSLIDPHVTLRAVRDGRGRLTDLEYTRINVAAGRFLRVDPKDFMGRRLRDLWSGEAARMVQGWAESVLETGESLSVDEQTVPLEGLPALCIDVRAVRVDDSVSFTWRDVTPRVQATQQIAESREHYRLLAENASEMVFQTGANHQLTWVSPSVEWVLGLPPEQLIGHRLAELIHPEDLPRVYETQKEIIARGELVGRMELRLATADGRWRWMSVIGRAVTDDEGRIIGGVDALRDIQAQKDAQAALEESEERFRRSMMDAAIGMAIVAPSGEFLRVNPRMSLLLGRDAETLTRSTWQELTHPDDLDKDLELVAEVLAGTRDTYRIPKRYVKPDGEVVWTDLTVSCVRDEAGQVRYVVSQIIDITESVRAQRALAESEEHYRLMAENSSDVVFRATPNGRLEWVSPSVSEVTGWSCEEILGKPMLDYLLLEDLPASLQLGPSNLDRIDFEGRCRTSGGTSIWMDISSRPLLNEAGELVGRVGRLRDIQAEHEAREALRSSEQRFRTAMASAPTGMAVVALRPAIPAGQPGALRAAGPARAVASRTRPRRRARSGRRRPRPAPADTAAGRIHDLGHAGSPDGAF